MEDARSYKNTPHDERLYMKIKSRFVENVDPRMLRHYLSNLRIPDEDKMLEAFDRSGRSEAAAVFLRLYMETPDWFDCLMTALRNPQIALGNLADEFESQRREVIAIMDWEPSGDEDGEQPMDVDDAEPDLSKLDVIKDMLNMALKHLVNDAGQLKDVLKHFSELSDVVLKQSSYGCLELHFRVDSLSSLYSLRKLYKGGALCDALSHGLLSPSRMSKLRKEAAENGIRLGKLNVHLQIAEEEFDECERYLLNAEGPLPSSYPAARAFPVDPLYEPEKIQIEAHLDKLPKFIQKFLKDISDLDPSQEGKKTVLSWSKEPLGILIENCMDYLKKTLPVEPFERDLVKIGGTLLCKLILSRNKSINTISVKKGELVCSKEVDDMMSDLSLDPSLSSDVSRLVSKGWLVEMEHPVSAEEGETQLYVPKTLLRDFMIYYLFLLSDMGFPQVDYFHSIGDWNISEYACIFYAYAVFQKDMPFSIAYKAFRTNVNVFLVFSSLYSHIKHAKQDIKRLKDGFSYLKENLPPFDRNWNILKTIAFNIGMNQMKVIKSSGIEKSSLERKVSDVEDTLKIGQGNVISLKFRTSEFDLESAMHTIALLDVIGSYSVDTDETCESEESVPDDIDRDPIPDFKPEPQPSTSSGKQEGQGHEDLSKRFSGSVEDPELLRSKGCLNLNFRGKEDYGLRDHYNWSFTLDMTNYTLSKTQVSFFCNFIPDLRHVTRYSFKNTGLSPESLREIIYLMNPWTVQGISLVGCPLHLSEGTLGLSRLRKLEFLDLENTQITNSDCSTLAKEISSLRLLKEFNIGGNKISYVGFTMLSPVLMTKVNLVALRIHQCPLGNAGAPLLAQLVMTLSHLEILSIWGCGLGDDGVGLLAEQFKVHKKMKRLNIRDNNMSFMSSTKVYQSLASCKYMQFFDCNENVALDVPQDTYASSILDMLQGSSSWDHVSFWNCSIGKLKIFGDPAPFQNLSRLTYLCLQKNGLEDENIKDLSVCIAKHFKYLQHLNLRENLFTDKGAEELSNALLDKVHLEELWADFNILGISGCKALINRALELPALKVLDLSFSYQLSPPEREHVAGLVGEPLQDGEMFVSERGQLTLKM